MKRLFDFTMALLGILITGPIMIIVAILIKINSKGPVIFKQKRLTIGMKEFEIYKFRSMRTDYDKDGRGIQTKGSSSAITPVGKFLRKTKLDELPQFFNIIKGDMSFVGPRPELPRRLQYYTEEQKKIFVVRSGISSPASIVFSDEEYLMNQVKDPERFYIEQIMPCKIELNKYYVNNQSFWGDIWIIVVTLLKIIKKIDNNKIVNDMTLLTKYDLLSNKVKDY
jgi:lipopolysaccharide/colanic/teichoic acid biosynthesis glycosyltransferase